MGRHSAPDDSTADDRAARSAGSAAGPTPDAAGSPTMVIEAVDVGRHEVETASAQETPPGGLAAVGLAPSGTSDDQIPVISDPPPEHVEDDRADTDTDIEPVAAPRRERAGTAAADFALVRSNRSLRARCAAAALAPFVGYVVVLLIVGAQTRTYLLFIFIPLITAGLAVGALLDAAHRRRGASEAGQDRPADQSAAPVDP